MPLHPASAGLTAQPSARRLYLGLLALVGSEGFFQGWASGVGGQLPPAMTLAYTVAQAVLVYAWWRADAAAHRGRPRPLWLSGLVIVAPVVGVPLHLWRSRPRGQRGRALLVGTGGVLTLALAYLLAGAPMAYWLGGR